MKKKNNAEVALFMPDAARTPYPAYKTSKINILQEKVGLISVAHQAILCCHQPLTALFGEFALQATLLNTKGSDMKSLRLMLCAMPLMLPAVPRCRQLTGLPLTRGTGWVVHQSERAGRG